MKIGFTIIVLLSIMSANAQADTLHFIKIHFLYGSKPLKSYKSTETKAFGGIHGGQVTIQVDSFSYGFEAVLPAHIFSHKKNFQADFVKKTPKEIPFNDTTSKTITFLIPVTKEQYNKLNHILKEYCNVTPYDYAFFGMRCAAAVQDILGQIGIFKIKSRLGIILTTFYPKKLRKKLFRIARERNYEITRIEGRKTRKWERD